MPPAGPHCKPLAAATAVLQQQRQRHSGLAPFSWRHQLRLDAAAQMKAP